MTIKDEMIRFKCTGDLRNQLETCAQNMELPMSECIRQAVREYIAKHGQGELFSQNEKRGKK